MFDKWQCAQQQGIFRRNPDGFQTIFTKSERKFCRQDVCGDFISGSRTQYRSTPADVSSTGTSHMVKKTNTFNGDREA